MSFLVSMDYETQSACNIKRGSVVYAEHPSTSVLIATIRDWASGRVFIWTPVPRRLVMPQGFEYVHGIDFLREMFSDPDGCWVLAHNHSFEWAISTRTLHLPEPTGGWLDSMDKCLSLGLPGALDKAGQYLFGMGKDEAGKRVAQSIWGPDRSGKLPIIRDDHIQAIIGYNVQDVVIQDRIATDYGVLMEPEWEENVRQLHGRINRGGIYIDQPFARQLRDWDEHFKTMAAEAVSEITGGLIQRRDLTRREFMRQQLNGQLPPHVQLPNMQLGTLEDLLESANEEDDIDPAVISVVKNYLVFSRAALGKVEAALNTVAADGRAYGQLRYWGAHTGRWSGYQIQVQNMKRPHEDFDIDGAVDAVQRGDFEAFKRFTVDKKGKQMAPYELLGSLVRGIIAPQPGCKFVISDFSQIEFFGLLWLAGDMDGIQEAIDYKNRGSDSYCMLASSMYGREITKKDKAPRQGGKVGVLACGYGGGPNAVQRMADGMGIDLAALEIDPQFVVDGYRNHYPKVVRFWRDAEDAFRTVLTSNRVTEATFGRACRFVRHGSNVRLYLPSGRFMTYANARMEEDPRKIDRDGNPRKVITYDMAISGQVLRRTTYGGKIVENCWSRDTLVLCRDKAKPIAEVTADDQVWDGTAWVPTAGAISQGVQEVGTWLGERVTPNHLIHDGASWSRVIDLDAAATQRCLSSALASAPSSWSTLMTAAKASAAGATVADRGPAQPAPSAEALPSGAPRVATPSLAPFGETPQGTPTSFPMSDSACGGSTATPASSLAATTPGTPPTTTTGGEASACAMRGETTAPRSCATPSPSPAGTKTDSTSTVNEMTGTTSPETCGSSRAASIHETSAPTPTLSAAASASPSPSSASATAPGGVAATQSSGISAADAPPTGSWTTTSERLEVFDLLNCGPRNRFTVLTKAGPVVVHNCTQAFCRDLMADAMLRTDAAGWDISFHVHDEQINEVPEALAEECVNEVRQIMCTPPDWAPDMYTASEPEIADRYKK